MAKYRLYALGKNGARVGEVDVYTRFRFRTRFNAPGTWVLTGAADELELVSLTAGIAFVRDDGETIFSGFSTAVRRTQDSLTFSGAGDLQRIADRLALPDPAGPPFTSQAYDVRTGAAETVIKGYVDANAGPSARSERRISGLTIATDLGRGDTVTGRARFHNLLDLCAALAVEGGGLGLRYAGGAFDVYEPEDKSATVVFSVDLATLRDFVYTARAPGANYLYAGGTGEGTARIIETGEDSESIVAWSRRIEAFLDQRNVSDSAELRSKIAAGLEDGGAQTGITLTPEESAAMQAYDDWWLGDSVSVVVDSVRLVYTIREIRGEATPDGTAFMPVAGTLHGGALDDPFARLYLQMRRDRSRVAALERV